MLLECIGGGLRLGESRGDVERLPIDLARFRDASGLHQRTAEFEASLCGRMQGNRMGQIRDCLVEASFLLRDQTQAEPRVELA